MAVTITEKAAHEIKRAMDEQKDLLPAEPENVFLRFGVMGGGCSGFQYKFGFDAAHDPDQDHSYEQHGIRLVIDKKSALYLDGTVIDFVDGIEKRGFKFDNPNVVKSCGCGSSFQA